MPKDASIANKLAVPCLGLGEEACAQPSADQFDEARLDRELVAQAMGGGAEAFVLLRSRLEPYLRLRLLARGASEDEAVEAASILWTRSVPGMRAGGKSLLAAYGGQSSPRTWLSAVVLNLWLDRKRKESVHARWVTEERQTHASFPTQNQPFPEIALVNLLKDSLEAAFQKCDAESLVLLRLAYLHGVSQRDLALAWGMPEYTLSRRLAKTMKMIAEDTQAHLRRSDPWLELKWEDFLELCETFSDVAGAKLVDPNV